MILKVISWFFLSLLKGYKSDKINDLIIFVAKDKSNEGLIF